MLGTPSPKNVRCLHVATSSVGKLVFEQNGTNFVKDVIKQPYLAILNTLKAEGSWLTRRTIHHNHHTQYSGLSALLEQWFLSAFSQDH